MSYNSNSINVNTNGVLSTPLTINATDTGNALTINNSSSVEVCSISNSGVITSGGKEVLTSGYKHPYCGGFVSSAGAQVSIIGRVTSSSSRSSAGKYIITYASAYPNTNYTPTITCYTSSPSPAFGCAGAQTSTTKLEVNTFVSNTLTDCNFYFMVF
jgi:hypothetical protein